MSTKGLKFSEETRRKMSEAHKGSKHPFYGKHHTTKSKEKISSKKKGKVPTHLVKYWTGRKQTEEHRQKSIKSLSINPHRFQKGNIAPMKGRKNLGVTGENHWDWKGGISPIYGKLRRLRLKENGGSHTSGEWENVKVQYGYKCAMCFKPETEVQLTKDHIIPVTKGGSDFIENIQPLCVRCNSSKNNRLIEKI